MPPPVRPPDTLDTVARALYRFRGLTPVPVLVLTVALCWREHILPGPGGPALDATLDVVGLATALCGWAARVATAGFEPRARSQSRRLAPAALHTGGMYQLCRHPLYLGNALMVAGLLLVLHRAPAYLLVAPAFGLQYALFIRAEERQLHEAFGAAWERWVDEVPLFWPRLSRAPRLVGRPFDGLAAARREANPLVAMGLVATLLLLWEWWARELLTPERAWVVRVAAGGLMGLLFANKLWKKLVP